MLREFTCIMCPQGCEIAVELPESAAGLPETERKLPENEHQLPKTGDEQQPLAPMYRISGNRCPRGAEYVTQELEHPMRNIATSILVEGGELPLTSVRLTKPVPRAKIFAVMDEIKKINVSAPVKEGTIVISNVLGLGSDVMVTKDVERK